MILLITLSVYTVVALPYDSTIRLWRGEGGVWLETPRNAQPYWVNYFGQNLPETIKRDSVILTEIIGLPITLARVLKSIDTTKHTIGVFISGNTACFNSINWKLTNEDGSDCTLDQLSSETMETLLKLLTK